MEESACNEGDPGSAPGLEKTPCRREWLLTRVFWPGEFNGQRSLAGYRPCASQRVGQDWATFTAIRGTPRSHPGPSACLVARMRGATNALSRYVIIYVSVGSESADTPFWLIGSLPTPLFKLSYIRLHCASWGRAVPSSSRCPPAGLTETNSTWWGEPHGRGRWAASRTRGPQAHGLRSRPLPAASERGRGSVCASEAMAAPADTLISTSWKRTGEQKPLLTRTRNCEIMSLPCCKPANNGNLSHSNS